MLFSKGIQCRWMSLREREKGAFHILAFFFNLNAGGYKFWRTWKSVITLNYINRVYATRFSLFDLTWLWVKVNPLHIFDLEHCCSTMNSTANITLVCACWIISAPLHHLPCFLWNMWLLELRNLECFKYSQRDNSHSDLWLWWEFKALKV